MLTGRDNELIDLGKMKVNPQLIEELVLDYAGVLDCGVFTYENVSGAHILAVAVVGDKDLNLKVMTSAIARELGEMSPKTYFIVDKIPRDSLGKVLRSELQKDIKRKISNRKNGNGGKS
jgi:acyl-coenzyme A synthetase/AMP-(fatty) acid ligase